VSRAARDFGLRQSGGRWIPCKPPPPLPFSAEWRLVGLDEDARSDGAWAEAMVTVAERWVAERSTESLESLSVSR
jgi:hypothetical protein